MYMRVIIMRGLPGSGKTTYAQNNFPKAAHISADQFFTQPDSSYQFDITKLPEAHRYCFKKFIEAVQRQEREIVVDNTSLTVWEIAPYILAGESYGYEVEIIAIQCKPEIAFKRALHRPSKPSFDKMVKDFNEVKLPSHWRHTIREIK
jgi:predicted kinase